MKDPRDGAATTVDPTAAAHADRALGSPASERASDPSDEPIAASPVRLLASLALATALAPLGSTMIAVALPSIGHRFHANVPALTSLLVTSYLLVGIVCQSPGGKLGDILGHRRALGAGQALFALGSLAGVFATGTGVLALARVLSAAGGALMSPAAMAMVRSGLPPERRARAFGTFGAIMSFAAAIGPVLGGELCVWLGWRAIFAVNFVPLGVSAALAFARRPARGAPAAAGPYRDPPASTVRRRPPFDLVGSVVLGAALVSLVVASRAHGTRGVALAAGGLFALGFFVAWERRAKAPVVDLGLFRRPAFAGGGAVIALQNLAMYSLLFQLPLFYSEVRGLGSDRTGRALLGMMLANVVVAPIGGRVSERVGARATALVGSLVTLVGVSLLRDVGALHAPADALPGLCTLGVGLGLCTAPCQAAAMDAASREKSGTAAGMLSTLRYLGGVAGIAVLGALLADRPGTTALARHGTTFPVYLASLALASLCTLALPGRPVPRPQRG